MENRGSNISAKVSACEKNSFKYFPVINNKLYSLVLAEPNGRCTSIKAKCLLCTTEKIISGDDRTESNFIKHLKRRHPDDLNHFQNAKKAKASSSQPTLNYMIQGVTLGKQKDLDDRIVKYIISGMRPLSTVEDPSFRELLTGIMEGKKLEIMSRYKLSSKITQLFNDTVKVLAEKMTKPQFICLTADAWSAHGRSFLGITSHWINEKFERESALLEFKRFTGTHSYDRIANEIKATMDKYGITEKVICVSTDNGANFCKAFKVFGSDYATILENLESEEGDSETELTEESHQEVVNVDVSSILDGQAQDLKLPPHFRCSSHTLNLIPTNDVSKVQDKSTFHRITGKCIKLWNLSSSPKCAEKIIAAAGRNFLRPVPTRWNSFYDSIVRLLEMKSSLAQICSDLNVPKLTDQDLRFLEDYKEASEPVALALDLLQGEKNLFMGSVLPTLTKVKRLLTSLTSLCSESGKYVASYIQSIEKRFGNILDVTLENPSPFLFGAVSHPFYKLRWLPKNDHEMVKAMFLAECRKFFTVKSVTHSSEKRENMPSNPLLDFSDSESFEDVSLETNVLEMEVLSFLGDPDRSLGSLKKYPTIRQVFFRYNTGLPSSAPVERVFSYAGLILSPRRCAISDNMFQVLVFLKCNFVFGTK